MSLAVRTRTFCCCVPVRAGAILLSILGFLGGGLIAAVGIINLKLGHFNGGKKALIIQVIVYIVLAILSFFGLIGAIGRKLGMVRMYLGALVLHLLFSIGAGVYAIHFTFKDSPHYVKQCTSGSNAPAILKNCNQGATLMKAMMIGVFVIAWLLETWACLIVNNYVVQLGEEIRSVTIVKDTEAW